MFESNVNRFCGSVDLLRNVGQVKRAEFGEINAENQDCMWSN